MPDRLTPENLPPHRPPQDRPPDPLPDRPALLKSALSAHEARRSAEAERLYRALLDRDADDAEVLHLLGLLLHQAGDGRAQGRALELVRRSLELDPSRPHVHSNLAGILGRLGRHDEAMRQAAEAARLAPDLPEAHNNLGVALEALGRPGEAEAAYREAVRLRPAYAEALHHLGNALRKQGRIDASADACRASVRLRPGYAEGWVALSAALLEQGMAKEAADCLRRAATLQAERAEAKSGDSADAPNAEAASAEAAVAESAGAGSSVLYTLHYLPGRHPPDLGREHADWAARFAEPLTRRALSSISAPASAAEPPAASAVEPPAVSAVEPPAVSAAEPPAASAVEPHDNDPDPDRRLRVGYVSPDFRDHTVPRFFEVALEHRDRSAFEVYCYSDALRPDATTARLRVSADAWRDTPALSHAELADLVRRDRIDVLVDLRGHGADNRLLTFARRPAPLQGVMVGYFDTTGLSAMDFRVTDALQDPFGCTAAFGTEQLLRLPSGCWCYRPDADAPPVAPPPALSNGYITFGSLNKLAKVSEPCARLWAAVLCSVPHSRLLLSAVGGEAGNRTARRRLESLGIPPDRLELIGKAPTRADYLNTFARIDVCLDPFPFAGITTTCDGLWMGVPFVTLAGDTAVSRAGLSLLTAAGLGEWAAETPGQYLALCAAAAADPQRLARLRSALREQVSASPLTDGRRHTAELEQAYRRMWRTWCARRRGAAGTGAA